MSRAAFFYRWFLGLLANKLSPSWGRNLGNPQQEFYESRVVSPSFLEYLYSSWESGSKPVFQSVNYFAAGGGASGGRVVALEKVFIDIDADDLDRAREEARKIVDSLSSFCTPLPVFSGRKGFHIYCWLPQAVEDIELYRYIAKVLGVEKHRYVDPKVFEPSRLSRTPYTLHNESKKLVTPLDKDFRPIAIESFSLEPYLSKTLPNSVVEEAKQLRDALKKIEAARKFWSYIDYLRNPSKALKASTLPSFVKWLLEEAEIPEGYRNNAAFILATWLMNKGFEKEEVLAKLLEWNRERCRPPLPEKEIENVVKSVFKHRYKPVSKEKARKWISINKYEKP